MDYEIGVEKETADTFGGKKIYTKIVDVGNLPNATSKTINIDTDYNFSAWTGLVCVTYTKTM